MSVARTPPPYHHDSRQRLLENYFVCGECDAGAASEKNRAYARQCVTGGPPRAYAHQIFVKKQSRGIFSLPLPCARNIAHLEFPVFEKQPRVIDKCISVALPSKNQQTVFAVSKIFFHDWWERKRENKRRRKKLSNQFFILCVECWMSEGETKR